MRFETNLPLKDTFHELNQVMDKVDYRGNRYFFESKDIKGSMLQGNLQAGLEFRLSDVHVLEAGQFVRRKSDQPRWYMDITVQETSEGFNPAGVVFHNRKEESEATIDPCRLIVCNFQAAASVMQPFFLGKYEQLQSAMESGDPVNLKLPALPGTTEMIHRCLDQTINSVLHSRILHNHIEGLFLSHLSLCWDELLTNG